MGSNISEESQTLRDLAQQLRLYKSPTSVSEADDRTDSMTETDEKSNSKRAAVLICLFEGNLGELRVILTKRASTLSSHSGEVSLPGGKTDKDDADDIATALREAKEEIGLDPSLVEVVSVLESFTNKRGMAVIPVIGIMHDKKAFIPAPNAAEVEAIFDVPLEMFLKDENRREEEREWMGDKYLLQYFDYEADDKKFVIWAITAGILIETATIVYQRTPAFLERRPNFWSRVTKRN